MFIFRNLSLILIFNHLIYSILIYFNKNKQGLIKKVRTINITKESLPSVEVGVFIGSTFLR